MGPKIMTESDEERALGGVHGKMLKVCNFVSNHEEAWVFYGHVTEEMAPGYSKIIRRPMCLKAIEDKIKAKKYKKPSEFVDDINLMFNNCRLYNGPDSEYTETADELEIVFAETMARILPNHSLVSSANQSAAIGSNRSVPFSSGSESDSDERNAKNKKSPKVKKLTKKANPKKVTKNKKQTTQKSKKSPAKNPKSPINLPDTNRKRN